MDVLLPPSGLEVGRGLLQVLDQRNDFRVLGGSYEVPTETGENLQCLLLPGVEQRAQGRTGEEHPQ
ncbi:hypothetical protein D9M69_694350 [compost metagenome]